MQIQNELNSELNSEIPLAVHLCDIYRMSATLVLIFISRYIIIQYVDEVD
jgi:hypothetical protein